jgi:Protein of unknown function (DUF1239).
MVALLLAGSAIMLLSSCNSKPKAESFNPETLVTMRSDSLIMSESKNGQLRYVMRTPYMERYELAREPYSKYPQGLYVETYKDSSNVIQSTIKADFAIYNEKRDEWMVTRNVVATGENGRTLYTEQLFYNAKTGRVYSNVESTLVEGEDIYIGEGFESDDKFEEYRFRNYVNRFVFELEEDEMDDTEYEEPGIDSWPAEGGVPEEQPPLDESGRNASITAAGEEVSVEGKKEE